MYRVIVVDDEILVREAICENINWSHLGYELVGNCENGKSAIEFLEENDVDVVLTDICMPYVDGMELSEYIHTNIPNTRIIIFSGYDEFEYAKKAIRYNVEDYLLKPVTAFELSEVLTKLKHSMDLDLEQKNKKETPNVSANNFMSLAPLAMASSMAIRRSLLRRIVVLPVRD